MKKKSIFWAERTIVCLLILLVAVLSGSCGVGNKAGNEEPVEGQAAAAGGDAPVTLQYMTLSSGVGFAAESQIFEMIHQKHPNITVEALSVPVTDGFVAAIMTKFAAKEAPDFFYFQSGTRIREFASQGLLQDITDEEFMKRSNPVDIPFNAWQGRVYGINTNVAFNGLFVNHEVFDKYNLKVPENWDELIETCQKLREAGLEYPCIMGGKDIGNSTQIDFQYMSTVIEPQNPNYYKELIEGTRRFNDPFIREMFEVAYTQYLEYCPEDTLGVDYDEAAKRFIRGDGVFWIGMTGANQRVRQIAGNEFNFKMYPSVMARRGQQRYFQCAPAGAVSICKDTQHLAETITAVTEYVSPEGCDILTTVGQSVPGLLGANKLPDPCFEPCREWFDSPYKTGHPDLVWVPGIKDIMKEITQKFIMGEPLDVCLNEWESQHRRLLDANPTFVANFGKE